MRTMWGIGVRDNMGFKVSGEEKKTDSAESQVMDVATAAGAAERKYREGL